MCVFPKVNALWWVYLLILVIHNAQTSHLNCWGIPKASICATNLYLTMTEKHIQFLSTTATCMYVHMYMHLYIPFFAWTNLLAHWVNKSDLHITECNHSDNADYGDQVPLVCTCDRCHSVQNRGWMVAKIAKG